MSGRAGNGRTDDVSLDLYIFSIYIYVYISILYTLQDGQWVQEQQEAEAPELRDSVASLAHIYMRGAHRSFVGDARC